MPGDDDLPHAEFARRLQARIEAGGLLEGTLLTRILACAGGRRGPGEALPEQVDLLVGRIVEDSSGVTDAEVAAVRDAVGSEKGAFEVVLAASIGTGLHRWQAAERAIEAAADASA